MSIRSTGENQRKPEKPIPFEARKLILKKLDLDL